MQAALDRDAKAARRTTLPPAAPGLRKYTPVEPDRTSAPSTPIAWRVGEGGASPRTGGGASPAGSEGSRRMSRDLRREGSAPSLGVSSPQVLGPTPHHLPVRLFSTSNYSSLTPSPIGTPSPLRRAPSSSPDVENKHTKHSSSDEEELSFRPASFPSFHLLAGAGQDDETFPLQASPLDTSPNRSVSPGPSSDYTFPSRPKPIMIPSSSPSERSPYSSSPKPKRKPTLEPRESGFPLSISPLDQTAAMPMGGLDRLIVSAPPSLVRDSSSGEVSDEEDNDGLISNEDEGSALRPPKPDKKISVSAEAVPTVVKHSKGKRKSVSPTDYLFPPLPHAPADTPSTPPSSKIHRVRSLSALRDMSSSSTPLRKSTSPSDLEKQLRRGKEREERMEHRIAELAAEVELLRVREDEWESQAEMLMSRMEGIERVAANGLEGLLGEMGVDLASTSSLILASSFARLSRCPICDRDVPLQRRASYFMTDHWACIPSITHVVALAKEVTDSEQEEDQCSERSAEDEEDARGRKTAG